MNYLITGATGFIGPYLIKQVVSEGHRCRCLIRPGSEKKLPKSSRVESVTGDITDPESLKGIAQGIDRLIHLATLGHMNNFSTSEKMFQSINVRGAKNIMREAFLSGVKKIVHTSSVAAVGICEDVPAYENSRCSPHHPYGRSKRDAEKAVLQMSEEQGLPAVIVRFSMVYGPGDWRDVLRLAHMFKRGVYPKIGNRPKLTPLIHVSDAVDGLLLALEKGSPGQIYHITNKRSEPFDDIAKIIQEALGVKRLVIPVPEAAALCAAGLTEKIFSFFGKPPPITKKNIESTLADRIFSVEKAVSELGFSPKVEPRTGLMETIRWYKENGWI